MSGSKVKLFRKIFTDKTSWRQFKKAYAQTSLSKRLELTETARKMEGKTIHHVRQP